MRARILTANTGTFIPSRSALFTGLLAAVFVGIAAANRASSGEICVSCREPAATYRCGLDGDEPGKSTPVGLQLLCIKELAARGGHKSCSVDRTQLSAPCEGTNVRLPRPVDASLDANVRGLKPTSESGVAVDTSAPQAIGTVVTDTPPATVEEFAKATAEKSKQDWDKTNATVKESTSAAGEKLEQAGSAVGSAMKKSLDCVASLFAKC